jgi:predicted porin
MKQRLTMAAISGAAKPETGFGTGALLFASASLLVLSFLPAAQAQDDTEVTLSGEASVVVGTTENDDLDADLDARVTLRASTILDNGLEVGGVLEARADSDIPEQYWTGGRYSGLTAGGRRGVTSGGGDAYLQGAYVYAKGGFGEISIGRDNGIASQLAVTSPTIFRAIGVNDWKSDLTGLNDVQTINDFSGYDTKITYSPPANFLGGVLGGLQLGVSYTPELEECGDDLCAPVNGSVPTPVAAPGVGLVEGSSWRDVLETAVYYERPLGGDGVRLGVGASYMSATEDLGIVTDRFDDYEAFSIGVNLAYNGITVGGSVKNTNAGFADEDEEGYLAFDAGVTYETGQWGFMLGYGASDAERDASDIVTPRIYRETQSAQAGVSYAFDKGITLGAAAQFIDSDKPASIGGDEDEAAVLFESSIKF